MCFRQMKPVRVSKDGRPENSKVTCGLTGLGRGMGITPIIPACEYQKTRKAGPSAGIPKKAFKGTRCLVTVFPPTGSWTGKRQSIVCAGCWAHARRYVADAHEGASR